jgi:hypothetical protein
LVSKHRAQVIYTRNTKGGDAPAAGEDAASQLYIWRNKTLLNQKKKKTDKGEKALLFLYSIHSLWERLSITPSHRI